MGVWGRGVGCGGFCFYAAGVGADEVGRSNNQTAAVAGTKEGEGTSAETVVRGAVRRGVDDTFGWVRRAGRLGCSIRYDAIRYCSALCGLD